MIPDKGNDLVYQLCREADRLEKLVGVPPGTAKLRWYHDELGWPIKVSVYIPEEAVKDESWVRRPLKDEAERNDAPDQDNYDDDEALAEIRRRTGKKDS